MKANITNDKITEKQKREQYNTHQTLNSLKLYI